MFYESTHTQSTIVMALWLFAVPLLNVLSMHSKILTMTPYTELWSYITGVGSNAAGKSTRYKTRIIVTADIIFSNSSVSGPFHQWVKVKVKSSPRHYALGSHKGLYGQCLHLVSVVRSNLECSYTDSPGRDTSPSQVPSKQCLYSFAAE